MNKIIIFIFILLFFNSCASNKKFQLAKENCKTTYGYFTKSQDCLELKFESLNPNKYSEYKELHSLILKALSDRVYKNIIDNNQAWLIYDDIIKGFNKSKDKNQYLITVLNKYS